MDYPDMEKHAEAKKSGVMGKLGGLFGWGKK